MRNYKRSEETEQMAVIDWCKINEFVYPELKLIYHIPNGGKRSSTEAARFKRAGVKAGVPDLHLPIARHRYHGLYIEMKYGNNKTTQTQKEWLLALQEQGYLCKVCNGAEEAIAVLQKYLNK
ncbi:MAG: VRR-NUC domain-containing protein [Paraclostridium sp.]